jgi:hypothetical protein
MRPALKIAILCVAGLAYYYWVASNNPTGWGVDFNQFYAGSHLAGTGQLYNYDKLSQLEAPHGPPMPTGRLPVEMFAVKLIGWLPYRTAEGVWFGASLLSLVLCVVLWPGVNRIAITAALALSMPAALLLVLGQDTPFWMVFFAAGLVLLKKERPVLAGIAFSLCIIKFHLALGIPILLLAQRRWTAFWSTAAAAAVWTAACFAIEGPGWPAQYMEGFRMPVFSPAAYRMLNLHGLAYWTRWPTAVELFLALGIVAIVWMICRGSSLGVSGAAAVTGGLLLGGHAYANDAAMLIPLLGFALGCEITPAWLKFWGLLLLTPLPIMVLVTDKPFNGQILIVGFAIAALVWELVHSPVKVSVAGAAITKDNIDPTSQAL